MRLGAVAKAEIWKSSRQLAEICIQGLMNEEYESAFEEWGLWLTQKDEEGRKVGRQDQPNIFLSLPKGVRACCTRLPNQDCR